MTNHKDLPYLQHIMDAIENIENSIGNISREQFISSKDLIDANIRRIEIIGEAVKNLSKALKDKNKEIEWNKIAGTRDIVIHKYFNVDLGVVWNILKKDIPSFKEDLQKIMKKMS